MFLIKKKKKKNLVLLPFFVCFFSFSLDKCSK